MKIIFLNIQLSIIIYSLMTFVHLFAVDLYDAGSEAPTVLSYNSPLQRPDSLKSPIYFDFLRTLYRHDQTKDNLFQTYERRKRYQQSKAMPLSLSATQPTVIGREENKVKSFSKRAIVFRPLFVYRQQHDKKQQIRRQQYQNIN